MSNSSFRGSCRRFVVVELILSLDELNGLIGDIIETLGKFLFSLAQALKELVLLAWGFC